MDFYDRLIAPLAAAFIQLDEYLTTSVHYSGKYRRVSTRRIQRLEKLVEAQKTEMAYMNHFIRELEEAQKNFVNMVSKTRTGPGWAWTVIVLLLVAIAMLAWLIIITKQSRAEQRESFAALDRRFDEQASRRQGSGNGSTDTRTNPPPPHTPQDQPHEQEHDTSTIRKGKQRAETQQASETHLHQHTEDSRSSSNKNIIHEHSTNTNTDFHDPERNHDAPPNPLHGTYEDQKQDQDTQEQNIQEQNTQEQDTPVQAQEQNSHSYIESEHKDYEQTDYEYRSSHDSGIDTEHQQIQLTFHEHEAHDDGNAGGDTSNSGHEGGAPSSVEQNLSELDTLAEPGPEAADSTFVSSLPAPTDTQTATYKKPRRDWAELDEEDNDFHLAANEPESKKADINEIFEEQEACTNLEDHAKSNSIDAVTTTGPSAINAQAAFIDKSPTLVVADTTQPVVTGSSKASEASSEPLVSEGTSEMHLQGGLGADAEASESLVVPNLDQLPADAKAAYDSFRSKASIQAPTEGASSSRRSRKRKKGGAKKHCLHCDKTRSIQEGGHITDVCWKLHTCQVCGRQGHPEEKCPAVRLCDRCGSITHTAMMCPSTKGVNGYNAGETWSAKFGLEWGFLIKG